VSDNPFLEPWATPFELPPFDRIQPEHFPPAFDRGMALKDNYSKAMLGKQGVYGVGIGMSEDNPPEPALVFFVDPTAGHPPFPAVIEGMRTKNIEDTPFE